MVLRLRRVFIGKMGIFDLTVLNVEYLSGFECVPVLIRLFLIILMLFGFFIGMLIIGISRRDGNKLYIIPGRPVLFASILLFIGICSAANTETDYISKKYVMFEDDKMPIEEFIDWEIVDFKGPIYILAPRDGKKIKDEEKSK